MQLVARHLFRLGAVGRLEIDDRQFISIESANEIDPSVDSDPWSDPNLNLLLGVNRPRYFLAVSREVSLDGGKSRFLQRRP